MKLSRRLLWFGIAGVLGLLVDVAVLTALRDTLGVYGARAASFLAAATATWLVNRHLSFAGRSAGVSLWHEYLRYLGLMLGGGAVNLAVYSFLAWRFSQTPFWLAVYVGAGSLAGMTMNYLGASQWLYRHKAPDQRS
ncbi:GtrA family protein [Ottowia thiooxydans]|uniref:GtrA family protein n=1 Tax=Ottowia thiooxydans TaxID=219182 RepID=UPI000407B6A7|nr:GtrA family protein [Ottowia thiooxydans]